MNTRQHQQIRETLAAWVLDACSADETSVIAMHVQSCAKCAAEASRLRLVADQLAVAAAAEPPADLRDGVLAAARRARKPSVPVGISAQLAEAYARQVEQLDLLLAQLTPAHWDSAVPRHGTVNGMVSHLAGNDAMLASDVGLPAMSGAGTAVHHAGAAVHQLHRRWHVQAQALVRYTAADTELARREVRLAGTRPSSGSGRDALVQRAFETWIHADDVRAMIGQRTQPPPPDQLRLIAELGISLLPKALRAAGRHHPGSTARLVLTGDSGGEWSVPLDTRPSGSGTVASQPDITVTAGLEDFCRLAGNRIDPRRFPHEADGDPVLVTDLLYATSTLGCD